MGNILGILTLLAMVAGVNEQILEQLLGRWENPTVNKAMPLISLAVGLAEGIAFKMGGLLPAELTSQVAVPLIGWSVAVGVVIGLGSGFVHKLIGRVGVGGSK